MNETVFYGYYGHFNTGDDAFIEVANWGATKFWGSKKNVFLTQNLPIIQSKAYFTGRNFFKGHHQLKNYLAILKSQAFICAGGSTFQYEINKYNPKRISALKKKYFQKFKLGAIGVSLGPYKDTKAESDNRELLKYFDFLALRDSTSYQIAKYYDLPYEPINAFDLAALLPEVYSTNLSRESNTSTKILGISLCNFERYLNNGNLDNELRRNKQIQELLIKLALENENIIFRFFIFNAHPRVGDSHLTNTMIGKLRRIKPLNIELVEYNLETLKTWSKIKECNLVLSTRLHAAIFACFANVPFYLVEYHRKCKDFLKDIGYDQGFRIYDAEFDVQKLADKIKMIINHDDSFIPPSNITQVKERAKLNFVNININDR